MKIKILLAAFLAIGAVCIGSAACAGDTVRLATLEWEPYIGPNLPHNGYVYQLVAEAFKRGGMKTEVRFFPWARALALSEQGRYDALFPEYYSEEREKGFLFSDPFPGGPLVLCKRKDADISFSADPRKEPEKALKALSQYRFGVVRGYVNTPAFDAADYLTKDLAVTDEMNLKKLYHQRIQLIIIDRFVARHLLSTVFPEYQETLEFMNPPLEEKKLYIAFSKNSPSHQEKCKAFNEGLKRIMEDGTLNRIMREHGFERASK